MTLTERLRRGVGKHIPYNIAYHTVPYHTIHTAVHIFIHLSWDLFPFLQQQQLLLLLLLVLLLPPLPPQQQERKREKNRGSGIEREENKEKARNFSRYLVYIHQLITIKSTMAEPAFFGAGRTSGLELWRIEKLKPVKQPKVYKYLRFLHRSLISYS